ncbi:hypothetical protein [Mycolicibacterium rhodesiae]|uniref:Uncharacterized protein n=1 Tax=Mycolicibacterium rhodesiae TaxID=36814 RepID=A0A1X0IZD1_MYCRH|nr:hypothetical protein [Mycolicibacterium rhodesiae]MCV7346757.1 hypothetical protein [Mycolicibacterium rhodesiae]ORB53963.1 hypothetical protein BST42_11315 [Mycolicibacterium rhodesiae]
MAPIVDVDTIQGKGTEMILREQAPRSSVAAVAALSVVAAMSLTTLATGPVSSTMSARLTALPAEVSSAIHDVLTAAHTAVHTDRSDVAADRQAIRVTRRDAAHAIGSSVLAGAVGEGQIVAITEAARSAIHDEHQAIGVSRDDIRQTRQSAAADIRDIITVSHDGGTVEDVRAILDTAKKDNAMTRSAIVADAQENAAVRRTVASENVAVRQSARAGDISKQEAAQQISAHRESGHTEIAGNRVAMAGSHQQITATRRQAARDVAAAVHNGRTEN